MSWEALEDLAAPPQLRGGALRWKPSVGTELGGGGGGTGASPPRPSPPPACPTLRSQTQEAQSPWPTSWARGELSGETHRPEKLLENSGWLPGSVTRRLSRPELPRLPALELGLPSPRSPQLGLSWRWSREPSRPEGTSPTCLPVRMVQGNPSRPLPCPRPAPRAPPRTTHPAVDLGRPAASPWVRVPGARPAAPLYRPVGGQVD